MNPIAIIGMAGIFPAAPDIRCYWSNIVNGVDAISDMPAQRWGEFLVDSATREAGSLYCRRGGFIDDVVEFDAPTFGISVAMAESADAEQMIALRVGMEAVNDAGYQTREFSRSRTGVIIGRGNYASVGTLPNLVASRLAGHLNLQGPAYTVDAACASSLLAVEQACRLLTHGECDLMLAGGVHFIRDVALWDSIGEPGALPHSQTSKPLALDSDGILIGEGIGILVLKRADAARRDRDRIYAVIEGVGSASDGNNSDLMAPSVGGQLLALQRAWQDCAVSPDEIGLLEAHGIGTPAGDRMELEAVREFFGSDTGALAEQRPVIGSVKSMIGHALPAAGIAGLIKAALAVYHGMLPPTLHCENPNPLLAKTRFRALSCAQQWQAEQRVAAVNAFGFGGINAHVVLSSRRMPAVSAPAPDSFALPTLALLAADSREELQQKLQRGEWDRRPQAKPWRLAIVSPNPERIALAQNVVSAGKRWHGRRQIYFSGEPLLSKGKVAFLFPGVDSEFAPQAQDIADYFRLPLPTDCKTLDPSTALIDVVKGVTQFNLFTFAILQRLGIRADAVAGHSIGEWSAMAAADMVADECVETVIENIDRKNIRLPDVIFLAAACDRKAIEPVLAAMPELAMSHDNCPHQVIVCGKSAAVERAQAQLRELKILTQRLPIVSGFHSPFFVDYLSQYRNLFLEQPFADPVVALWSCTTARPFPYATQAQQQLAIDHLVKPVMFRQLIENMYADGYRAFIQLGTGSLSGFVQDILRSQPHLAVSVNSEKTTGLEQLCCLSAALWVEGLQFGTQLLQSAARPASSDGVLKLHLGSPPLRREKKSPIDRAAVALNTLAGDADDPMYRHVVTALSAINQISSDIIELWNRRCSNTKASVSTLPAPLLHERRIKKHLDVHSNIECVLDHSFHRQREGWPNLIDRRPIVPLTMELMLLREIVEAEFPGYIVVRFEDIAAYNWLVVAEPVDIDCVINASAFPLLDVKIEGHLNARAVLATAYPEPPPPCEEPLINARECAVDAATLYRDNWLFHGPAYQGVIELGPIGDNGIRGRVRTPVGNGALLDSMGQLAGYWVMEQENNNLAMPIGVETVCFYSSEPPAGTRFDCNVFVRKLDAEHCVTDQQLIDADGRVCVAITAWRALRYPMSRDLFLRSMQLEKSIVSTAIGNNAVLFADYYDTAVVRDFLARRYLSEPELALYDRVSPRSKRGWLNGRIAGKDAVRSYLWKKHGQFVLYPKEIAITNNAAGAPVVAAHISHAFAETLYLSLSHKDCFAAAIVGEGPVGVDIESIAPRSDEFVDLAFTAAEQRLLPSIDRDEWIARLWTAKESAAKAAGTGFLGNPKNFSVRDISGQRVLIGDTWIETSRFEGYVIGWKENGDV